MILRILQILTFVLAATIQVRVHAAEVVSLANDSSPIQEPANCLDQEGKCALKVSSGKKFQIQLASTNLVLGSSTAAVKTNEKSITLVNGTVLVKSENPFFIESEFGKVIVKNGECISIKDENKISLRVLSGEVYLQPRGESGMILVHPGQQNFLSAVDDSAHAHIGIPTSTDFTETALIWSSLYSGNKIQFAKDLKDYGDVWRKTNVQTAELHKELAERRIASIEEQREKQQSALKKRQAYESQLRALFRKKSLDQ